MRVGADRRSFTYSKARIDLPNGEVLDVSVTADGDIKIRAPRTALAVESMYPGGQGRPTILTLVPSLRDAP